MSVLAWTILLIPALGVPGHWMVQDTLKSAMLAVGTIVAALVFFWQERQRDTPLLWHGLIWLPLTLMAYALGSMVWSHTYLAGVEAVRWFVLALLLWLVLNTLNRDNLAAVLKAIHWGTFIAACWAALQFWGGLSPFPQGPQPAATFYNRNFFAEYAVCALPYSVWLLASMRQSPWLPAFAITVALNVAAILMTGTRSALLALLALVPMLVFVLVRYRRQFPFFHWRRRERTLVGLFLLIGILGLGSIPTNNPEIIKEGAGTTALQRSFARTASVATASEYTSGTFSVRTQMWTATARMLMAHPLVGVGAGAWEVEVPLYQRADTVLETDFYAHNELLQLLAEYGLIVGGTVSAFLFAYWLHALFRTVGLKGAALPLATWRALPLIGLVPLLIVSNAGFPLHLAGCGALLILGLGILAISDARAMPQEPLLASAIDWRPAHSKVAFLFLAGCLCLTFWIMQRAARAEFTMAQAARMADKWVQAAAMDDTSRAVLKSELLRNLHESLAINPHERKFSVNTADLLAVGGDLQNATWILETVAKSRPHVTNLWYALAMNYALLGHHDQAQQALRQVQRLKPKAWATLTLEVSLLNAVDPARAIQKLSELFDQGVFDLSLLELGYSIGRETQEWDLAVRALKLTQAKWPERAPDAYFKLGSLYAEPDVHETAMALEAFQAGLLATPLLKRDEYLARIPLPYRHRIQKKPLD